MNASTVEWIQQLVQYLRQEGERLVIDADAHVTDIESLHPALRRRYESNGNYYHGKPISAEYLLDEMDMANVDMALIWQNPAATMYSGDLEENAGVLLAANRYVRNVADKYPRRFIPAGWVDPRGCGLEGALAMVDTLVNELGFAIVKLNPAQNQFPIDSPEVFAVVDRIVALGAVPAVHFGADTSYTPAAGLRRLAERHAKHPVLAVHMGGGGAGYVEAEQLYHEARSLGLEYDNIRYVLSARRETHTENDLINYQLEGEPSCLNLFCGSDAPYGRVSWNFGGFRAMFETLMDSERHPDFRIRTRPGLFTPEVAQGYLGGNAAAFLAECHERLLDMHKTRSVR